MIPQKDLDQLPQYYKGELTENALVSKAARLAAKNHVLLADPKIPPAIVNAKTKPLSQELSKLTKQIRQFPGGVGVGAPGGAPGEEEEEKEGNLFTGPVEQWLKRMIKGSPSTPNHKSLLQDEEALALVLPSRKAKRPPVKFPSTKPLFQPVEEIVISQLVWKAFENNAKPLKKVSVQSLG